MTEAGRERPTVTQENRASPNSGALDFLLGRVLGAMNALGSLWIFVLMILINLDAGGRTWFAAPMDGVVEMIELTLVAIVFLQLGDATRSGRLTRSDGFFQIMLRKKPVVGRAFGVLFDALGIAFMVIILWGSLPILFEAYRDDFYVGTEGIFTAPVWPVKLIIVIGCVVTALQFAAFGMRYLNGTYARPETDGGN
ncbi:MAG: TRAP transporter small permease [Rhodospirillaceae bacterium]|jgi:TRAP-type mannitol/chloroaromatic compound transport system permease small subunit|nr:TRAP transporter small permease [Rhodospirillaceae bacterium]